MIFTCFAYTGVLADLAAGELTSATTVDALLATSGYAFAAGHSLAEVEAFELAWGGYLRFEADSVFTVAATDGQVHFSDLDPAPVFGPMTTADWRYLVLVNHGSGAPYLCLDCGATRSAAAGTLSLLPGAEPYLRLVIG